MNRRNTRGRRTAIVGFLLLFSVPLAQGQERISLAADIIKMLEAGMFEEIILEWLEVGEAQPETLTAEELIALQEAGASERLLTRVISLWKEGRARVQPAETSPGEAVGRQAERPEASGPEESVMVAFQVSYAPRFDEDTDEWDLFVYLDGKPLTYVPVPSMPNRPERLEFRQPLAPGRHLIRVAQEQHLRKRRGRWRNAARVAGEFFEFELAPGPEARVEVSFQQRWMDPGRGGPLSWQVVQAERARSAEDVGGDPDDWPQLCEEIESNARSGKKVGSGAKRQLETCTRWSELWPGFEVPERREVREALALFDYRPVAKSS